MGGGQKTIGGSGGARKLGKNYIDWLGGGLDDVGLVGAGGQRGLAGLINQYLTPDFNDPQSTALMTLANQRKQSNIDDLRSRYNLAGTGYGTPASSAEANFRAEFDPQLITQLGNQKLQVAMNLLGLINGVAGRGISQAQTVQTPGFGSELLAGVSGLSDIIPTFQGFKKLLLPKASGPGGETSLPE